MTPNSRNQNSKPYSSSRLRVFFHPYAHGRISLFFLSVAIKLAASGIVGLGFYISSIPLSLLGTFLWVIWFVLISLVAVPATDEYLKNRLPWLKSSAVVATLVIFFIGSLWGTTSIILLSGSSGSNTLTREAPRFAGPIKDIFHYNDTTALFQQAAENLIQGKNPYAEANVVSASLSHDVSVFQITPLRRGLFADAFPYPGLNDLNAFWIEAEKHPEVIPVELESRYIYPAGSFLILIPFLLVGIQDIRIVFALLVIISLMIVIRQTQREGRLVITLAFLVGLETITSIAAGDTGVLQFPFLLLAWIWWKKHWLASAIFLGLAITIKQVSWIYLLFYLVLVFREMGKNRFFSTLSIVAGLFLLFNLPFIVLSPPLWISSLISSVTDPIFPLGVGIITLVTSGLLVIKSALVFNLASILVLIAGLLWYYRNCRRYPYLGLVLAILPFFFAWRSLWGYLFFADYIALACIITHEYYPQTSIQPT